MSLAEGAGIASSPASDEGLAAEVSVPADDEPVGAPLEQAASPAATVTVTATTATRDHNFFVIARFSLVLEVTRRQAHPIRGGTSRKR
jgi:hypothetical protein